MQPLDMKELEQVVGGVTSTDLIDLVERFNRYQQLMQSLREPIVIGTSDH
jgi:bacteriocin-like protein